VRYNLFVAALEETSRESLEFLKDKALKVGVGWWVCGRRGWQGQG
jgi:hypothetical protein